MTIVSSPVMTRIAGLPADVLDIVSSSTRGLLTELAEHDEQLRNAAPALIDFLYGLIPLLDDDVPLRRQVLAGKRAVGRLAPSPGTRKRTSDWQPGPRRRSSPRSRHGWIWLNTRWTCERHSAANWRLTAPKWSNDSEPSWSQIGLLSRWHWLPLIGCGTASIVPRLRKVSGRCTPMCLGRQRRPVRFRD